MQFAKDSFYMALRDRLAALNPQRTIALDGALRPAILVTENESVTAGAPLADCFLLQFGSARETKSLAGAACALLALDAAIVYLTRGAAAGAGDRGRALAELDSELLQICAPPTTPKFDYTQIPVKALGTSISWARPQFDDIVSDGDALRRTARLTLFFFPEVQA